MDITSSQWGRSNRNHVTTTAAVCEQNDSTVTVIKATVTLSALFSAVLQQHKNFTLSNVCVVLRRDEVCRVGNRASARFGHVSAGQRGSGEGVGYNPSG